MRFEGENIKELMERFPDDRIFLQYLTETLK
jgi:hypothetical protein